MSLRDPCLFPVPRTWVIACVLGIKLGAYASTSPPESSPEPWMWTTSAQFLASAYYIPGKYLPSEQHQGYSFQTGSNSLWLFKVPWLWEHCSIDNAFTTSSLWRPGHCWGIQNATTANWSRMTVSCEIWVWPYLCSKRCHVGAVKSFKVTMPNSHRQTVLVITHEINLGLEQS